MAEADQDPIVLLERICRLESTMDATMLLEEDEPTVRMGQDGFALALTQAKLARLEVRRPFRCGALTRRAVQLQHAGRALSRPQDALRQAAAVRDLTHPTDPPVELTRWDRHCTTLKERLRESEVPSTPKRSPTSHAQGRDADECVTSLRALHLCCVPIASSCTQGQRSQRLSPCIGPRRRP